MIKEKDFPDGGWKKEGDGAMRKEIRYQMILWAMAAAGFRAAETPVGLP